MHYITDTNNKHLLHLAPIELSVYQQITEKKVIYHEMKHERNIIKIGKIIIKKISWTFTAQKKNDGKNCKQTHKKS